MYLQIGEKIIESKVGYVANFCPICRSVQSHSLYEQKNAVVLYEVIQIKDNEVYDYFAECDMCKFQSFINTNNFSKISKEHLKLRDLISETYPNIYENYSKRFVLEDTIKKDPMSLLKEERHSLIFESFKIVDPFMYKNHHSDIVVDKQAQNYGLLIVFSILGGCLLSDYNTNFAIVGFALAFIFLTLFVYQLATSKSRFRQEFILPLISKALLPLKPKKSELEMVYSELARQNFFIVEKIKIEQVLKEIMKERKNVL